MLNLAVLSKNHNFNLLNSGKFFPFRQIFILAMNIINDKPIILKL